MARKLRVEYPQAIYHLMNRGDRREPIFRDDDLREARVSAPTRSPTPTAWFTARLMNAASRSRISGTTSNA